MDMSDLLVDDTDATRQDRGLKGMDPLLVARGLVVCWIRAALVSPRMLTRQ